MERVNRAIAGIASQASATPPVVSHLALSPDGQLLAAGLSNGTIRIYRAASLAAVCTIAPPQPAAPVRGLGWLPDGASVLVALCRVDDDSVLDAVGTPMLIHADAVTGVVRAVLPVPTALSALAVTADGALLALATGNTIEFLDVRHGLAAAKPVATYHDSHSAVITGLRFHPSLTHVLLSGGDDGLVCAFDTRIAGEQDAILSVLSPGCAIVGFGAFGPHGAFAYVLTSTGGLSLWNIGSAERSIDYPALPARFAAADMGANALVDCFADSSSALFLLAGDDTGKCVLLEVTSTDLRPTAVLEGGHTAAVRCAISASAASMTGGSEGGIVVYTGGEDGAVTQWAAPALKAHLAAPAPAGRVKGVVGRHAGAAVDHAAAFGKQVGLGAGAAASC
jgi:WD40 repeat protein